MAKKIQQERINIIRHPMPYPEAQEKLSAQLQSDTAKEYKKGMMESMLQLAAVNLDIGQVQYASALMDQCEGHFAKYGDNEQKGLCLFIRGRMYSHQGQYEDAMNCGLKSLHLFISTDVHEYTAKCYVLCGIQCRHLNMYTESLDYMTRAVQAAQMAGITGLTCMCMQNMNEVKMDLLSNEEAIKSFNDFLKYVKSVYKGKDSHSEANALLCLSELYLQAGDILKAKESFLKSKEIKTRMGSNGREVDFINRQAEIASAEGNEDEMLEYTGQAIDMSTRHSIITAERWAYTIRFEYYAKRKDISKTKEYLHIVHRLIQDKIPNQLVRLHYPMAIKYYQATGEIAKELEHMRALSKYELEKQQQITLYRLRHATAIHELEIKEKENDLMKKELNLKTQELNLTNHHLLQRDELLNDLKECIQSLKQENSKREVVFQTLFQKIDLAFNREQNDKARFKSKFDTAHNDFIRNLSKTYPKLSSSECRICALLHSGFNTKEIATLLSTTLRNIETHRLNIRKKMDLKRMDNLQLILAGIER